MRHWPLGDIVVGAVGAAILFTFVARAGGSWQSRTTGPLMSWRSAVIVGLVTGLAIGVIGWFATPARH